MTWISVVCFGLFAAIALTMIPRGADVFSPARVFGIVWTLSLGLAELKLSGLQHAWSLESWVLLLIGIASFLIGLTIGYVRSFTVPLLSIDAIRARLLNEEVNERRIFILICTSSVVYATAYLANYFVRGWLPVDVIGTAISRVDFNVSGLTLFTYVAILVIFFNVLYFSFVRSNYTPWKRITAGFLLTATVASFVLLLMRYPIIMVSVVSVVVLYYATRYVQWKTAVPILLGMVGFFYWISSLRLSHVVSTYLYSISRMRISRAYAAFTEPYMYVVTNLENFARSVVKAEYFTYGYFTFDFLTALTGLKYWVLKYFQFERTPYLTSNYNTYTAFWWFYSDFGVIGICVIPFVLGLVVSILYYRMRQYPTIASIASYGVAVFAMFISYFNFPLAFLWFNLNVLLMYLGLKWVTVSGKGDPRT